MRQSSYPFDDFLTDFDLLDGKIGEPLGPFQRIASGAVEHFLRKYPLKEDRIFRYTRFLMCVRYFAEHVTNLNGETHCAFGSPRLKGFLGESLLQSVHMIFVDIPIDKFDEFTETDGLLGARRVRDDEDYRRVST